MPHSKDSSYLHPLESEKGIFSDSFLDILADNSSENEENERDEEL